MFAPRLFRSASAPTVMFAATGTFEQIVDLVAGPADAIFQLTNVDWVATAFRTVPPARRKSLSLPLAENKSMNRVDPLARSKH